MDAISMKSTISRMSGASNFDKILVNIAKPKE